MSKGQLTEQLKTASTAPIADQSWQSDVETAAEAAAEAILRDQAEAGHWMYPLEADCTITAEYIMMNHFTGQIDDLLEQKMARYLRSHQQVDGGWPLFHGGSFDVSCSVKAYFALKLAGDDANASHMQKARRAILAHGGAARSNVFTRVALALFKQVPWRAVPCVPVELALLPRWFPFHISKVSYWSRTVMVPLSVLCTLRPAPVNSRDVSVSELFTVPPELERHYFKHRSILGYLFYGCDRSLHWLHARMPDRIRRRALRTAEKWIVDHLNGEHGLGGIFPAIVNAYEALSALGYSADHPHQKNTRKALRDLVVDEAGHAYCQPCMSPVWDTALASLALAHYDQERFRPQLTRAMDWLETQQLCDAPGDWRASRPNLPGGGWAFQFRNDHYPDLDDTPAVAWGMHMLDKERYANAIQRATTWTVGMQSKNGGFASFDADNTCYYLNAIPFADHGALLDPPTSDVSARCLSLIVLAQDEKHRSAKRRVLRFIKREQEANGSWYGRWGTNYIYGTWSVLMALGMAGEDLSEPHIQKACNWLKSVQRPDGGWGESNQSYYDASLAGGGHPSTAYQTAWALLALMAVGEGASSHAVVHGIRYLLSTQSTDGLWHDRSFTSPGFPRVFFLRYHGYKKYFPLWALARYRELLSDA